jgi:hypothetical protein
VSGKRPWEVALADWVRDRGWDLRICSLVVVAAAITGSYTIQEADRCCGNLVGAAAAAAAAPVQEVARVGQSPVAAVVLTVLVWVVGLMFAVAGWVLWSTSRAQRPKTGAEATRLPRGRRS